MATEEVSTAEIQVIEQPVVLQAPLIEVDSISFIDALSYTESSLQAGLDAIAAIAASAQTGQPLSSIEFPVVSFDGIESAPPSVTPMAAVSSDINLSSVGVPQCAGIESVAPIEVGPAPVWDGEKIPINLDIPIPSPLSAMVPIAPVLDVVVMPEQGEINLPQVPTLSDVIIPIMPVITLPVFDDGLGDVPLKAEIKFAYAEEEYTSDLLSSVRMRLTNFVNGESTGIAKEVEYAIWNRERDREQTAGAALAQDAIRQFSVRGFTSPPGALAIALQRAAQSVMDNSVTLSRDIAIKQADLEQQNRQFFFGQAVQVESALITYASSVAARALDAAKSNAQFLVDIFRAELAGYDSEVRAFTARAEVFKTLLEGELSKLDILRAELEAQKLIGDINKQEVDLYVAQIGASNALIESYKARVQAASAIAEVQKTRIQAFGAEVQAYGETVRAKASEYDMMATRVKAEVSKAEIYKIDSDVYESRINGYAAETKAKVEAKNSEIKSKQEIPIEVCKVNATIYDSMIKESVAQTQSMVSRMNAETDAQAKRFDSDSRRESSRYATDQEKQKTGYEHTDRANSITAEITKASNEHSDRMLSINAELTKANLAATTQLAAASISTHNYSNGESTSHNYSNSASTSTVTSDSTSKSRSYNNSASHNHVYQEKGGGIKLV